MDKYNILKEYFGHDSFRTGQDELIDNIFSGRDCVGIMPTGAGKSICYQVPAIINDGLTIVISPLISLMKDQVEALVQSGVRAAYLNSSLTPSQQMAVFRNTISGKYKILYVSPERLVMDSFVDMAERVKISLIAVDEAHCISQWGQDFRPSYLKICDFINMLSYRPPICALTATATSEVREDIVRILGLRNPFVLVTGFDRQNLYFEVQQPRNKFDALLNILEENKDECTIIYCSTRKSVEEVYDKLKSLDYAVTKYHAGLTDEERHKNQDDFLFDRCTIMAATNAFGMGIDKSNVTLVVHYNMPKNIESYYQEAGRAGRDGSNSKCILLYSGQDVRVIKYFIDNSDDNQEISEEIREVIRKRDMERLRAMNMYCVTGGCLREYILRYFGETAPEQCGNCGNCKGNVKTIDVSIDAQKIVSCVYRVERKGRSCGKILLADILHGSENSRISKLGLDEISTYGIMSDTSIKQILDTIDLLVTNEYLSVNDEFGVIETNNKSMQIIKEMPRLSLVVRERRKKTKNKSETQGNSSLFEQLKALRTSKALEAGVPAYVIFSDATLRDMASKMPITDEEFLSVSGVGNTKLKKYGKDFMDCIKDFLSKPTSE